MINLIPGLAGVPATKSKVSFIDGEKGILEYRGIPIEQLVEYSNFLETSYLLIFGRLPKKDEYEKFVNDIYHHRRIKFRIVDMMKNFSEKAHPMEVLQSTVSALGMFYPMKDVLDEDYQYEAIVNLIAKIPTIIAGWYRIRNGDEPIKPDDSLNFTENFFYMMNEQVPDKRVAEIFDKCLILHAEHTMNASTFAALVVASTLADPYTVMSSALGALSGPLHGGANEKVFYMLMEIGEPEKAREYIENKLKNKERIMGFGHRVYKTYDPRAKILEKLLKELMEIKGETKLYKIAKEVEKVAMEHLSSKGIYPNVDFYSGIIYYELGIPVDMYTSIFAMARISGWLAHWKEYIKENKLFRPSQIYEGSHNLPYVPLDKR